MKTSSNDYIDIDQLRLGLFVHLDLGWMAHPFPLSSFKLTSAKQIATIRSLGLTRIRISHDKSDPAPMAELVASDSHPIPEPAATQPLILSDAQTSLTQALSQRRAQLAREQQRLLACEKKFGAASTEFQTLMVQLDAAPEQARQTGLDLVGTFTDELESHEQSLIRLLSEGVGDRASQHSINVTVISLLLGQALGLRGADMADLGMAALVHDAGKAMLPDRVRWREEHLSASDARLYQSHVGHSVLIGQRMGLSNAALTGIAQHHEMADGSGFPLGLKADRLTQVARILALVNQYDELCNPGNPTNAMTPHEALALIFAQMKLRFESRTLATFIRMMGVYPPGSVVQLIDERYAMVVSVSTFRPLRPRVIVHDAGVPRDEAMILDLEAMPELGIRRSLKPLQLPKATMDYLSPRKRICYFFDRAVDPVQLEGLK